MAVGPRGRLEYAGRRDSDPRGGHTIRPKTYELVSRLARVRKPRSIAGHEESERETTVGDVGRMVRVGC